MLDVRYDPPFDDRTNALVETIEATVEAVK
jgi:hypothetical protein